jgi:hypothetical protein
MSSHEKYQNCIRESVACAEECEHCGQSLDGRASMGDCIRACRDCAELCWVCAGYMSRGSQLAVELCGVCARACELCADECEKHDAEHCKRCAAVCRSCAHECREVVAGAARGVTR